MTVSNTTGETKVWDIFIRLFHWSLVFSFIVAYLTGDDANAWHINFGYAIGFLLVFRVIWGFIGSKYARFSSFTFSSGTAINYMKDMLSTKPKHYLGHNPAGAYMVFALLFMLTITTVTGLKAYAVEGYGPLAGNIDISLISSALADEDEDDDDEKYGKGKDYENEFWEEAHEVAANLTLLLVILHVLGVIVSSRVHKENLVGAMITGKKQNIDET